MQTLAWAYIDKPLGVLTGRGHPNRFLRMDRVLVSPSGLRGEVGGELTPELITRYAAGFGRWVGPGPIVVGRDSRRSSELLFHSVAAGLGSVGCDIWSLGLVPTPTAVLLARLLKARGGLMITASHNPIEWNGLKFIHPKGRFLSPEEFADFSSSLSGEIERVGYWGVGRLIPIRDPLSHHIERILDHEWFRNSGGLRVGVDACNGAMSEAGPRLLRGLGYEVFELYCTPDGTFPRPPEPTPRHLSELSKLVRENSLSLGFAFDPDGDRVSLVDETGTPLDEELTLSLSVWFVLERRRGPVVANLSTTRRLDDLAQKFGVPLYRTPVGEAQVVKRLCEVEGVIGGEGNGGVILPDVNLARDGLVAAALLTQFTRDKAQPLSSLVASLPQYSIAKRKAEVDQEWEVVRERVVRALPQGDVDYSDGIRIDHPDFWVVVRPSRTEGGVRIIAEARDQATAEALVEQVIHSIRG